MLSQITEITDDDISEMPEEGKTMIPDMLLGYLYVDNKNSQL